MAQQFFSCLISRHAMHSLMSTLGIFRTIFIAEHIKVRARCCIIALQYVFLVTACFIYSN